MWRRSCVLPSQSVPRAVFGLFLALTLIFSTVLSFAQIGKPEGLYYRSWAVIIGIEDYLVAPKLPGAVDNGKRVAEALRRAGFEEVVEIYNKEASSKHMQHVINDVLPRKLGRGDRLVFYFSGQAGQTTDLNGKPLGYLVPWDAQLGSVSKSVTLDQLKEFGHRVMAKHMVLLLDAPVSGWEVTPSQQLSLEGRTAPELETDKRALQVLSAGTFGESLVWKDGQSPFAAAIVAGLGGAADRNKNGWLMASELADYVRQEVGSATQGAQHPQYARLDGDGDTILIEGKPADFLTGPEPRTAEEKAQAAKAQYEQAFALLQAQKSPDEALERLDKAIALNPTYGDAYVLKSYVRLEIIPDLPEALAAAQLAVKYAPENPDSYYTLGLIHEKNKQYVEAEKAFQEAIKTNPTYADVFLSLGVLYEDALKDPAKAGEAYRRYQELGGTDSRASLFLRKQGAPAP